MNSGRKFWSDKIKLVSRIIAVLIVSILLVDGIRPAFAMADEQEKQVTANLATKTIYKWTRITYDELVKMKACKDSFKAAIISERGRALMDTSYGRDMETWPMNTHQLTDKDYPGLNGLSDTMYTAQKVGLVTIERWTNDGDNGNRPMIRIKSDHNNQFLSLLYYKEKDSNTKRNYRLGFTDDPRVVGSGSNFGVSNITVWKGSYGNRYMKFQFNIPGKGDEYIFNSAVGKPFAHSNDTDYDEDDEEEDKEYSVPEKFEREQNKISDFIIYKVTEEKWSCLANDFTVNPGQLLRFNSKVYIGKDVTLTVDEDAVFTIDGLVMSDGTIKNKGTTVLQKNAVLQPLMPVEKFGKFICEKGGDLVLMEGSKMLCRDQFILDEGSTCINFGTILSVNGITMNNSYFDNRQSGFFIAGYDVYPSVFASGKRSASIGSPYTNSRKNAYIYLDYENTGNFQKKEIYKLYGKMKTVKLNGRSKFINHGCVVRNARLLKSPDSVYDNNPKENSGSEINTDNDIKIFEEFLNKEAKGIWYWREDGGVYPESYWS